MAGEFESRKDLVNEKATRHDNGRETIPTPCGAKGTLTITVALHNE